MLIIKAKHGKRRYQYGGGSIVDTLKTIATSPFAQKLAIAAVTGAAKGLVQGRKRAYEEKQEYNQKSKKIFADKIINGKGIVLD
jgi:hypothetical protein